MICPHTHIQIFSSSHLRIKTSTLKRPSNFVPLPDCPPSQTKVPLKSLSHTHHTLNPSHHLQVPHVLRCSRGLFEFNLFPPSWTNFFPQFRLFCFLRHVAEENMPPVSQGNPSCSSCAVGFVLGCWTAKEDEN